MEWPADPNWGRNALCSGLFFVLLLLAWMVCVLLVNVAGVAIHLLLVLAAIVLLVRLVGGTGRN